MEGANGRNDFPPLDLAVEYALHVGATRVANDRAVAERPGSPFHPPLKPANHPPLSDGCSRPPAQFVLICDVLNRASGGVDLGAARGNEGSMSPE